MSLNGTESGAAYQHDKDGVLGVFYNRPKQDMAATEQEGRPVYALVPYCKIVIPGDMSSIVDTPAKDQHRQRFPDAWKAFSEKREGAVEGAPIEQFPLLNTLQVAELKHLGIVSVEQLASVKDSVLPKLGMDGRELRERARQWLQGAGETEKELRAENAELKREKAELEARVSQLTTALEEKPAKRKPGRPRNAEKVAAV